MNSLDRINLIAIIGTADYIQTAYADLKGHKEVSLIGLSCFDYYRIICLKFHIKPLSFINYLLSLYFVMRYCSRSKKNIILLHGVDYLWMLDLPLFTIAKKWRNIKVVGLFWDSIDFVRYSVPSYKDKYDLVISCDTDIVNKYKVDYYPSAFYSKITINKEVDCCDVFFCGEDGGRLSLLERTYKELTEQGLNCSFYCARSNNVGKVINGVKHIDKMSYFDYLAHMQSCRIILDIVKPGVVSPSFRYCEGIVYDKKVLTNNKLVKELPLYDKNQFYVYDESFTIEEEFLKTTLHTSNIHKKDLSPFLFVDYLCTKLNL